MSKDLLQVCRAELDQKLMKEDESSFISLDFEVLSSIISFKTNSHLLPSSLKRFYDITNANSDNLSISIETKNIIARYLEYANWSSFEKKYLFQNDFDAIHNQQNIDKKTKEIEELESSFIIHDSLFETNTSMIKLFAIPVFIISLLSGSLWFFLKTEKHVSFFENDTLFGVESFKDSSKSRFFYFNNNDEKRSYVISYGDGTYYYPKFGEKRFSRKFAPGVYYVKVFENEKTIKKLPLVVSSNGWINEVVQRKENEVIPFSNPSNDFHFDPSFITSNTYDLDTSYFLSFFRISRIFDISLDDFSLESDIQNSIIDGGSANSKYMLELIGSENKINLQILNHQNGSMPFCKFGDLILDNNNKLGKAMIQDISLFKKLKLTLKNKKISVSLNNQVIFDSVYKENIGKLYGIKVGFAKAGRIKNFKLFDETNTPKYTFNGHEK